MKLNPISTRVPISDSAPHKPWVHPWYTYNELKKPNPPTAEAIEKAQFVDKTYDWRNAGVRPGDGRSPK
ncbi:MAG: hypothetical protein CMH45_00070 [Muricauda sp.]|jgi:hypothetical protein|nr:hypothetical protein [Allomuricauda sp.]